MVVRLQHASVPRPPGTAAVARQFYGEVFGLEEVQPPAMLKPLEVIWYRLDRDTELHIFVEEPAGQDHSGRHFCLAVDDLEEMRARLEAAGVTVASDIPLPGRPRFFVRDPFGNLIEVTTIEDNGWPLAGKS